MHDTLARDEVQGTGKLGLMRERAADRLMRLADWLREYVQAANEAAGLRPDGNFDPQAHPTAISDLWNAIRNCQSQLKIAQQARAAARMPSERLTVAIIHLQVAINAALQVALVDSKHIDTRPVQQGLTRSSYWPPNAT